MLYVYPGPGPMPVVQMIAHAHHEVDLNTYELTSEPVEQALAAAGARDIKVHVILDRKPYRGARILLRERQWCDSVPVQCKLSSKRFRFDHAKYLLVDDKTLWVGTMNFTYYGLNHNREAALETSTPALVRSGLAVFRADWNGTRAGNGPRKALVLSPGANYDLRWLIGKAKGPVDIETEEMGSLPKKFEKALASLGSRLRIILPSRASRYDRRKACTLAHSGAHIRLLSQPYPHIKTIITSAGTFMGSENLSWTSLKENREMGVILPPKRAGALKNAFSDDWSHASPLACQG